MIRKPRTGKRDNGDGTSTERWLCGCEYDTDNQSGRIVAERPCPRHAQPPVPGNANIPQAAPPSQPRQPPAPGPHGPHVATVNIWSDGYTETAYTLTGHTETHRGECAECAAGTCAWCAFYPRWDRARQRYVHQWERCPAHQEASR